MTTKRPYPNVRPAGSKWQATHPRNGTKIHLGTFDSPEAARRAVLIAQAEHLESKAADYREAAQHFAEIGLTKRDTRP